MWFAFKLISLSYWIQQLAILLNRYLCCDLLSNLYLCHIEYSPVVRSDRKEMLWFAFKLISLSYWIQLGGTISTILSSCDLLSNLYLCHIEYSPSLSFVSCFKLWFAFKLISLSYWIQQGIILSLQNYVVICFQTYIFVILNTAS